MKFFQFIISPGFRQSVAFSLKTLTGDSSYKICTTSKSYFNISLPANFSASSYVSINKFHTTCCTSNDIQGLPISNSKKRLQRKKAQKLKNELKIQTSSAIAYSSAEEYRMPDLIKGLKNQDLYQTVPLPKDADDDLHLCVKAESREPQSHIYIFREGSVVFWNFPESERKQFLSFLKPYEINSYDETLIEAEKEDLDYTYSEDETRFHDGYIILNSKTNTDLYTYTFSHSLVQSVKLGILEAAVEEYSDSIKWVVEKMKKGEKIKMSREEIFTKRGELYSLRHIINLSSDLLDTPDFYWNRKELELLYQQTCNYMDIKLRIRTMNARLDYCSDLINLLGNNMSDEHHVRLEWIIIILIMVEVVFECLHYIDRSSDQKE